MQNVTQVNTNWKVARLCIVAVGLGWLVATVSTSSALQLLDKRRLAPLSEGTPLPKVTVYDQAGKAYSLPTVLSAGHPNVLVLVSARCSKCFGELQVWNADVFRGSGIQVTALILTDDKTFLEEVRRVIRPQFPIYQVGPSQMDVLHAKRTPAVYVLDERQRVLRAAVGVYEVTAIRETLSDSQDAQPAEH